MAFRRRYGKRKPQIRKKMFRGKKRSSAVKYSKPTYIKRTGHIMRIYNSPITGSPTVLNNDGNGSVSIGSSSTDTGVTVQFGGAMKFMMQSALDFADMATLFDRYKITGVKLKFLYQHNNASNTNTGNNSILPLITTAFDGDDDNNPSNYIQLASKQYSKQRVLNGNSMFSVFIKPRLTKEVYRGALTTGYTSEKACWLDCNNQDIAHFGLKLWINNWTTGATILNQLSIFPTYYFALKDTQ